MFAGEINVEHRPCARRYRVPCDTVDVHNVSVNLVVPHNFCGFPGGNAQAQNVHVENFLVVLRGAFQERAYDCQPRVVYEYVDRADVFRDPFECV